MAAQSFVGRAHAGMRSYDPGNDRILHGIHKSVADAGNRQVSAVAPVDRQEDTDRNVKEQKLPDGFKERRSASAALTLPSE